MRIISKFHDYYDSVQAFGTDPNLIYLRETKELSTKGLEKELELHKHANRLSKDFHVGRRNGNFSFCIIFFCGKAYLLCRVYESKRISGSSYSSEGKPIKILTSIDQIEAYVKELGGNIKESYNKKYTHYFSNGIEFFSYKFNKYDLNRLFDSVNNYNNDEIFQKIKSPIFTFEYGTPRWNSLHTLVNPNLKQYNFSSVMDPFNTYQMISQYLSGVIGQNEPETLTISDEIMRDKKGFDNMSFKTYKGTKKPRRKNKC